MKFPPESIQSKELDIQRAILFGTLSSILLNLLFICYQKHYIQVFEILQKEPWKYYNSFKQHIWIFGMFLYVPYIQGIVFYIWRYHYNFPIWVLALIMATLWAFWDGVVSGMLENGSIYSFWILFDILIAGALWVVVSFNLYDRFGNYLMEHKKETIMGMVPLFIITQFIVQYRFYVYNRDTTSEKSYIVTLGDEFMKMVGIKKYSIKGGSNPIKMNMFSVNNPIL